MACGTGIYWGDPSGGVCHHAGGRCPDRQPEPRMNQTFHTLAQAISLLTMTLPKPPTDGFRQMLGDLFAIGLPVSMKTQAGAQAGACLIGREGIELSLADIPLTEGVIAHEVAHALLETRGWPRLYAP